MADAEAPPATEAVSAKDKAIHAEQAAVAKAKAFEKRLVADGGCCAKFPTLFGAYAKQVRAATPPQFVPALSLGSSRSGLRCAGLCVTFP